MSIKTLLYCSLTLLVIQSVHAATYRLHTVQPGGVPGHVRITNLLDVDGLVEIRGFDDQGEEYTGGWLDMEERASVTLSGRELEQGAPDKGLYRGIGDGSGGWQLELQTDLEIGALSFVPAPSFLSGAGSIVVLSTAETPPSGGLPSKFLWAHELVGRGLTVLLSPSAPRYLYGREGRHELLSAYDWIPHQKVRGVELGWGDHEYPNTEYPPGMELWTRYGGHLTYSAFAVHYGMLDGQYAAHAYLVGDNCISVPSTVRYRAPHGTRWSGALVAVSPDGSLTYGPATVEISQPGENYAHYTLHPRISPV